MYLNHFQVVNYKNLKTAHFSFVEGVNTIIGENDSGKSNAMTALRILLDDSYYYNTKRLKDNDFSDTLNNWKGHWIIFSAVFGNITSVDKQTEICAELVPDNENEDFLKSYIKSGDANIGVISLFIRPQKQIRKKLSEITDPIEFEKERNRIRIADYEFYFTSRAQTDFTNDTIYKKIVGDLDNGQCTNPDEDDDEILGCKLNIADVEDHISVVFVDALRDVESELKKPKNPIRRIIESVESLITESEISSIKDEIMNLNKSISEVEQVELVGKKINEKLLDMIGMVYSPEIILESGMKDDLKSLSRYLFLKPSKQNDIESLGLGHLNMIYMALKIVEYDINRTRELINIMIIEEPEAHIHTHIQRTLFDKLKVAKDYTQIITTTHSTHLAEVSNIKNINILKSLDNKSISMRPNKGLDEFGEKFLNLKNLTLSNCIERYLDAKRTVLLFSKGVILVEGDGEEILIPNIVKSAFGVSLDELGIGLINVGSVSFEYIASLFADIRINRSCAIVTDQDVQIVENTSSFYKTEAQKRGESRKDKLEMLYGSNIWVKSFYAPHTLEIDFALTNNRQNKKYINEVIELNYSSDCKIKEHKNNIDNGSDADCANTILTLAGNMGKGWYATFLSNYIDSTVCIPQYILAAIAFASREIINVDIIFKMVEYSLNKYEETEDSIELKEKIQNITDVTDKKCCIQDFRDAYEDDVVSKLLIEVDTYCERWCG